MLGSIAQKHIISILQIAGKETGGAKDRGNDNYHYYGLTLPQGKSSKWTERGQSQAQQFKDLNQYNPVHVGMCAYC